MKLTNAYEGVKKIFTAEILALIASICSTLMIVFGFFVIKSKSGAGLAVSGGGLLVFALAAGVLAIIAFIIMIIGVNKASKDEPSFKTAFFLIIAGIVLSFIGGFFSNNNTFQTIVTIVSDVVNLFITIFVIQGCINLANKVGNVDVQNKGATLYMLIIVSYALVVIAKILSMIFTNTGVTVAAAIIAIISGIISIVQYFLYLSFLSKTKAMLA